MSGPSIRTSKHIVSVTVSATLADCTAIDFQRFSMGIIDIPSGSVSSLTYYHCATQDGTFQPLRDKTNGVPDTVVTAGSSKEIHEAAGGCQWIKLESNATDVVIVSMKF